jgi:hypothetical protein
MTRMGDLSGTIYITDEPGKHDLALLDQMTAPTVKDITVILRPSVKRPKMPLPVLAQPV